MLQIWVVVKCNSKLIGVKKAAGKALWNGGVGFIQLMEGSITSRLVKGMQYFMHRETWLMVSVYISIFSYQYNQSILCKVAEKQECHASFIQ